ncbi:MAG: preprotein translocase subunit SecA [Candidatus Ryanbacteria bacterium RIFCSPHIGHO2_01_FULL_45_22]|uniref:Protein translocase subunit SecA n=2 Tax=Candidatus Ryaniibacteriota TaxID=1817914 RepID=A0A1G2FZS7_9BACT|nr:MAG: preprotein translocase subunit SecA [Candidatus Ryanbacteria bacterium RIFCSPHIGHO2_01_FULL_45_22]OGZ45352.1 MAG: preprotein translocase subunit SecA [Candidatus Ryanbacteria bacterium RIFCSPHIGHO2_02_FULL_45_13b]
MSIFSSIFGDANSRFLKGLQPLVERINALEPEMQKLVLEDFPKKTQEFKERLHPPAGGGESLDDLLPEAFALVREAARRTLGQRHFDVQLLGGMVLHKGQIAEMRTGEGKTLTATLPIYLNALEGNGVHVVTVNDYLARRDMVWMGQVYYLLGLQTGCITHSTSYVYDPDHSNASSVLDTKRDAKGNFEVVEEYLRPCTRKEAYAADITYGTNNEYGFDYLRDNLAYQSDQVSQREHAFAIIDEVDSILIDEARTPLIISAPDEESGDLYKVFAALVPKLKQNEDYNLDEKVKAVTLTEAGIEKVEQLLGVQDIYTEKGIRYVHHLEQALKAHTLFAHDRDYVVKDGEVIIVDEFTGRLMPGRRWSEGLHQAVEAKEGVIVQRESRTLASITFQNYFRLYEKIAGMAGTAQTSAEEFHKVYHLDVTTIPTNRKLIRDDKADKVYQSVAGKYQAVMKQIKECRQKDQPILVGTVSIEKNELLSAMLKREGIPHQILNAKHHEQEGAIIAQAGRKGVVTIATNMAGRGVDIILGGNPSVPEEAEAVRKAGGLFVLGTGRHEARRIDDQLRGRAGRQGDPGASQFFVSLEDDLMRVFGSDKIKRLMGTFGIPEDEPIENRMVSRSIESAQSKIEGFHFDARKHLLEYDDVMNKQREAIYRMRRDFLNASLEVLRERVEDMIKEEMRNMVSGHAVNQSLGSSDGAWHTEEMVEQVNAMNISIEGLPEALLSIQHDSLADEEKRARMIELLQQRANVAFAEKIAEIGENAKNVLRYFALQTIDYLWTDHLEVMDYARSSVRLRAYGQRDPLVEYKNEALRLFQQFNSAVAHVIVANILKFNSSASGQVIQAPHHNLTLSHPSAAGVLPQQSASFAQSSQSPKDPKFAEIGRNDPCPCGSGKKYKKCHGV